MNKRLSLPVLLLLLLLLLVAVLSAFSSATVFSRKPGKFVQVANHDYYFLFSWKMRKQAGKPNGKMLIVDGQGTMVFFRKMDCASDFKIHPGGEISYWDGKKHILTDSYFRIRDSVACVNGIETDSHDFQILPNGHYLLIGMEACDTNLSGHRIFMQKDLPGSRHAVMKIGVVQELDRDKKLVYEWRARPYYKLEDADKIYLNDTSVVDITHFNSVEQDKDGNLLISARYSNELIKVRRSDGKLIWRMGGKYNEFKFVNDTIPFLGQHDARIQPDGSITLFDNGYASDAKMHGVRALEYEIDEKQKTAKLRWSVMYDPKLVSDATGNMQRLADSTTLINFGRVHNCNPNILCARVDRSGEPLFVLSFADTLGSYRSFAYPKLRFELPRPLIRIKKQGKQFVLEAVNYDRTMQWPDGSSAATFIVTKPGTYTLYKPYGDGWICSEPVLITQDMLDGR